MALLPTKLELDLRYRSLSVCQPLFASRISYDIFLFIIFIRHVCSTDFDTIWFFFSGTSLAKPTTRAGLWTCTSWCTEILNVRILDSSMFLVGQYCIMVNFIKNSFKSLLTWVVFGFVVIADEIFPCLKLKHVNKLYSQ